MIELNWTLVGSGKSGLLRAVKGVNKFYLLRIEGQGWFLDINGEDDYYLLPSGHTLEQAKIAAGLELSAINGTHPAIRTGLS